MFLVYLVLEIIVVALIYWAVTQLPLPLPEPAPQILKVIFIIVLVLLLLNALITGFGGIFPVLR